MCFHCFPELQLISFKALGLRHGAAKTVHACLQLASLLFGSAAFIVVLLFHNSNKFPNFYRSAAHPCRIAFPLSPCVVVWQNASLGGILQLKGLRDSSRRVEDSLGLSVCQRSLSPPTSGQLWGPSFWLAIGL